MHIRESDVAPGDIPFIAENLRESDLREIHAYGNQDLVVALSRAAAAVGRVHVLRDVSDRPICLYGLHRTGRGFNSPWMLGTNLIAKNRKDFWTHSQRVVREFDSEGLPLLNAVHGDNAPSIRWLTRLGFEIIYDEPVISRTGAVFYPFERISNVRTN